MSDCSAGPPVKHILSFGGGVNTFALMVLLVRTKAPLDGVLFADTGAEVPETYHYLNIAEEYLNKYGIPLHKVANRIKGRDLFGTCQHRRVFPSAIWRWSTRDFKVRPIHRYYRSLQAHINQYVGIAWDEIHRMKNSQVPFVTNLYPLIDNKLSRVDCVRIIEEEGLPVPVKSGCFFCPFNSLDRWAWLQDHHPELFERAIVLEEESKHYPSQRLTDQVYRNRGTVTLREMGKLLSEKRISLLEVVQSPCGNECMT